MYEYVVIILMLHHGPGLEQSLEISGESLRDIHPAPLYTDAQGVVATRGVPAR